MDRKRRLQVDLDHLHHEVATIELISAHATGHELERMRADQRELKQTIASKQRQLCEIEAKEEGGAHV